MMDKLRKILAKAPERRKGGRPFVVRPFVETLEERVVPATYNVIGFADGLGVIIPDGADTFTATTLRGAIEAANATEGVADVINLQAGVYTLSPGFGGDLDITDDVQINGMGLAQTVVYADPFLGDRVFDISSTDMVRFTGFTVANGFVTDGTAQGAGIRNDAADLTLTAVGVVSNVAEASANEAYGGGIFSRGGSLVIIDSLISDNQALGDSRGGTAGVGSSGVGGGGIFFQARSADDSLTITNTTISGNLAQGGFGGTQTGGMGGNGLGGGLATDGDGNSISITDSTITGNQAVGGDAFAGGTGWGGGVFASGSADSDVSVLDTDITDNTAIGGTGGGYGRGGGIGSRGGALSITSTNADNVIEGNTALGGENTSGNGGAGQGGGIWNDGTVATISGIAVTGNSAQGGNAVGGVGADIGGNSSGGGIRSETVSLAITNSTISLNEALGGTGGSFSGNGGNAQGGGVSSLSNTTITGSTVSSNRAQGGSGIAGDAYGGGIFHDGPDATLTITNSTVSGNKAEGGSSPLIAGVANGGGLVALAETLISGSTVALNQAIAGGDFFGRNAQGGGILARGPAATISIDESLIFGNFAQGGLSTGNSDPIGGDFGAAFGGGINLAAAASATISNSTISGNSAIGGENTNAGGGGSGGIAAGGGVGAYNGSSATISDSTISGNRAVGGAGFDGGNAYGGGVEAFEASLFIEKSTISGNSAIGGSGTNPGTGHGGGVYSEEYASITYSTISGNSASGDGGGLHNLGYLRLSNSTISGNSATQGGGVFDSSLDAQFRNATITQNSAATGGGLFASSSSNMYLYNSILAQNQAGTDHDISTVTSTPFAEYSLIGDIGNATVTDSAGNQVGGNGSPVIDALLGPLQDNGGPTLTHAPRGDSPAVNAGGNALVIGLNDQRGPGFPRIVNVLVDLGAVETSAPTITSPDQATFTQGEFGSFTITTTGTPFPSLTIDGALPDGISFVDNGNGTATLSGTPAEGGDFNVIITADNGIDPAAVQNFNITAITLELPSLPTALANNQDFTIIGATGSPTTILSVKIFDGSGNLVSTVQPFNNLTSLRVAAGDFDGDGVVGEFAVLGRRTGIDFRAEIVTYNLDASGNATETGRFFAFDTGILGNGFITAGDFDGDGDADLAVAQIGGDRNVVTLQIHSSNGDGTFTTGGSTTIDFGAVSAPRIGAGDTDGDGLAEIVVAARTPSGASVLIFDADTGSPVQQGNGFTWTFGIDGYSRGAFVAVGEFDPTSAGEEIILGSNVGGGGRVDIVSYDGDSTATLVGNGRLTPFGDEYNAAIRVGVGQLDDRNVLVLGQDRFQSGQYTIMARQVNTGATNPMFEEIDPITALTSDDGLAPATSADGNRTLGPFVAFANLTNVATSLLAPSVPGADLLDGDPDDIDLALAVFDERTQVEQDELDALFALA